VALVDDARMRSLNRRYRRRDRATDVLAFPQDAPKGGGSSGEPVLLGDVVISVETAARRAGFSPPHLHKELERYLVHGLLHLVGWDHGTAATRAAMRGRERSLERAMWGVGRFSPA